MTNAPSGPGFFILIAVFAWAIYRRVRRNIGRQELKPARIIGRMVILSLATLFILAAGVLMPVLALTFAGGALVGVACSFIGLRHTKFETTPEGHFYTPNTYIGVALSILLLARMAYRMYALNNLDYQSGHPAALQSPLTFCIIGLTIGYYLAYSIGLFVHTHDKR